MLNGKNTTGMEKILLIIKITINGMHYRLDGMDIFQLFLLYILYIYGILYADVCVYMLLF